jgi:putative MFS transporter
MVYTAAERLDRLPILHFHRRLLFLIGAGMFFDSFDIYLAGSVLGELVHNGWSNIDLNARFISATFIGMVIGAAGAGILGDLYGRRFSYQFNLAIFGLGSLACAAAPNMDWLIGARFVSGIGLGAEIVIGYATMLEFIPPGKRGRWAALLSLVTNFGLFAATLISWLVIPSLGWRPMFIIAGIGALIVLWMRKAMPESPRWLELKGREAEANEIVKGAEAEAAAMGVALAEPRHVPDTGRAGIWSATFLKPVLAGSVLQIVLGIAIYGFVVWVPTFLVKQGMPINKSLGQAVLMSMGGPAGAALGWLLSDRLGRRASIIAASLLAAICGPAFAYAPSQEVATLLGFLMFTLIYFLVAIIVAGYIAELFPTAVRMRGTGITSMIGRLTTIFVPFGVVALVNLGGVPAVLAGISVALIVQTLVVIAYRVETKGRSLEAITVEEAEHAGEPAAGLPKMTA